MSSKTLFSISEKISTYSKEGPALTKALRECFPEEETLEDNKRRICRTHQRGFNKEWGWKSDEEDAMSNIIIR